MKLFLSYLKSKWKAIAATLLFFAIFMAFTLLYSLPLLAFLYPAVLCAVLGVVILICDYLRVRETHKRLQKTKELPAVLTEIGEKDVRTVPERDLGDVVASLLREIAAEKAEHEKRERETVDYYTVWAHQIKTPLSSMKLTLQNEDSDVSRRLKSDLFRTEQYVEMVLAYLRLGSSSTDFVFREKSLDEMLRTSVKKFAGEFIGRKLSLTYEVEDENLVTDEKWFSFVIEQLLSNALKYTKTGGITVKTEGAGKLTVSDTGIGIAPEDLPRIFEKGYTGYNGRTDKEASGLGLYLVRRVCGDLGINITITSKVGEGSSVTLILPKEGGTFE